MIREILFSYQEAIASIIGFVGVIVTLIVNGRVARNIEQTRIENERVAFISALRAELKLISQVLTEMLQQYRSMSEDEYAMFSLRLSYVDVFNNLQAKLGLLTEEQSDLVIVAYTSWKELPDKLLLGLSPNVGINMDYSIHYIHIQSPAAPKAFMIVESVRSRIDKAIQGLKKQSHWTERIKHY